jgi:beta-lactamase regulating signal transducer with metallopeptidase domain
MPALTLYLLKLSISLSVVWLFYQLLLRRLTFYNLNRWYLLFYSLLSFFIPLIDIGTMVEEDGAHQPLVVQIIPSIGHFGTAAAATVTAVDRPAFWNTWSVLLGVAALGSLILLIRLARNGRSLYMICKRARLVGNDGIKVYQVDEQIIPFSFGNAVYLNQALHSEKELGEIILHEYVHIRQKHTIDILLAELFIIVNWYNPFVWLIRYAIRQNLEFIADSKVLEKGMDRKAYQYHLLKVIGHSRYKLANNFNFSSLKKRIVMMNRIRSARVHVVRFLFILPLIAVLLVSFRNKYKGNKGYYARRESISTEVDTGRKAPFDPHDISIGVKQGEFYIGLRNGAVGEGTRMLFVIDGVPAHFDKQRLTMQSVYAVHVLSQARARALYGDKSENGVVAITTRNSMKWDTAAWGAYRSHGTLSSGPDTVYTYWHL